MKQMKKWGRWMIGLLAISFLLAACDAGSPKETVSDTGSVTETETEIETETETETLSPEEEKKQADEAYLEGVDYMNYTLTGENAPYYVGRWFEKEINGKRHMVTTTDGSHLYFMVEGATQIKVSFTCITAGKIPYFSYSIDGAKPMRQRITNRNVPLPDDGRHTVRIIADGMTESEAKWQGEIGFALKDITVGNGTITGIKPTGKTIFFYGDSITEGIVSLCYSIDSDGNSATNAYPWHTAEALGAVPYYIGYGATGLIATGSFHNMLNAIDHLSDQRRVEESSVANVTPDLIVVNHGANDHMASDKAFEDALRRTIARLQEKYPGVEIVYMVPFWSASNPGVQRQEVVINRVAAEVEGMHVVHTAGWALTYTDSGLHPNVAGAEKAGDKLAEALIAIYGEAYFKQ